MNSLLEKTYSTAELMKTFSLGRNTLRLYEEMGLLHGMTRTESGYRQFKSRHIEDLKFILEAKKVGFTLNEVKALLEVVRNNAKMTCGTVALQMTEKVQEIDEQLKILQAKKDFLSDFLQTCDSNNKDAACDVVNVGFKTSACCRR